MPATPTGDDAPAARPIEVELAPEHAPSFAAIVKLRGEIDMATTPKLVEVLTPLKGNLLLDLSECDFVDSSFVHIVVRVDQTLKQEGYRVELLVPPEKGHLQRALVVSGVLPSIPVRPSIAS